MAKYKVLKEFVMNGINHKVDSIINLDKNQEKLTSIMGNLEKAPDNLPVGDGSALASIIPGQQLTPEQKEKLAKENIVLTEEAQRLAADQRTRDVAEGRGEPPVQTVANLLKDKLEKEDFQNTPPTDGIPTA